MKKLLILLSFITTISSSFAATYVMKIKEEENPFVIKCGNGKTFANNKCNDLIARIDTCPSGYSEHNATECISDIQTQRTKNCPSGYTYSVSQDSCQTSSRIGSANGRCGGGYGGCSARVGPNDCYYTCSDGNSFQGWYYETCSTGTPNNGWCEVYSYTPYSLSSCQSNETEIGEYCVEIVNKNINVCPEGTTGFDNNYCY